MQFIQANVEIYLESEEEKLLKDAIFLLSNIASYIEEHDDLDYVVDDDLMNDFDDIYTHINTIENFVSRK